MPLLRGNELRITVLLINWFFDSPVIPKKVAVMYVRFISESFLEYLLYSQFICFELSAFANIIILVQLFCSQFVRNYMALPRETPGIPHMENKNWRKKICINVWETINEEISLALLFSRHIDCVILYHQTPADKRLEKYLSKCSPNVGRLMDKMCTFRYGYSIGRGTVKINLPN